MQVVNPLGYLVFRDALNGDRPPESGGAFGWFEQSEYAGALNRLGVARGSVVLS
jgi:hypothetical protein